MMEEDSFLTRKYVLKIIRKLDKTWHHHLLLCDHQNLLKNIPLAAFLILISIECVVQSSGELVFRHLSLINLFMSALQ